MWKDLTMKEKAAMMKVAILNGITDLDDIIERYNRFDNGGSKSPLSSETALENLALMNALTSREDFVPTKSMEEIGEEIRTGRYKGREDKDYSKDLLHKDVLLVQNALNKAAQPIIEGGKVEEAIDREGEYRKERFYPYKLGIEASTVGVDFLLGYPIFKLGYKGINTILNKLRPLSHKDSFSRDILIKSDYYRQLVDLFGKEKADKTVEYLTSKEFQDFFFKEGVKKAKKKAVMHKKLMDLIKDVENAGGILGGSAKLALLGTIKREGLLHDLDFFVPSNDTKYGSSVFDALGLHTPGQYSLRNNPLLFAGGNPLAEKVIINKNGIINVPLYRKGVNADMFLHKQVPTNPKEAVEKILDAKRMFGRKKDITDINNFRFYSENNPMISKETGIGLWNPTLFDLGIITKEGYPIVTMIETFPNSSVKIPAIMNTEGQIIAVKQLYKNGGPKDSWKPLY